MSGYEIGKAREQAKGVYGNRVLQEEGQLTDPEVGDCLVCPRQTRDMHSKALQGLRLLLCVRWEDNGCSQAGNDTVGAHGPGSQTASVESWIPDLLAG